MDLGFQGKLAIVTGSTAGIGFAIASRFAKEGAEVIVNGRTAERVTFAIEKIAEQTNAKSIRGITAALGTDAGVESFIKEVPRAGILINNLSIFDLRPFLEIPNSEWLRFFEVNVMSVSISVFD